MPKDTPDRNDERGGFRSDDPQTGAIGNASDARQRPADDEGLATTGAMGQGEEGQGGQRTPGGSSRD
jgi:hypothetical protein